jgi:hypothetical protein
MKTNMKKQYVVELEVLPKNPGIKPILEVLAIAKNEDHATKLARQFARRSGISVGHLIGLYAPDFNREYLNRTGEWS